MRTEIRRVINLQNFFNVIKSNERNIIFSYDKASKILLQNIYTQWLQFIHSKTNNSFPVFLNKSRAFILNKRQTLPYGWISQNMLQFDKQKIRQFKMDDIDLTTSELCLNLVVPSQDIMQFFMQWQRYRKYWWSSITTTPSLFMLSDIKQEGNAANVNILANFNWGQKIVETISINTESTETSYLNCKMSFEDALFTILLDGLWNSTNEEYLRLHNKMAPYKIALALDYEDSNNIGTLRELAILIAHKLEARNISTWLPNVLLPLESQLKENFQIGVTYTAILNEFTLSNGIFNLLNSSTMLKEHIHIADFVCYAALLCGKK